MRTEHDLNKKTVIQLYPYNVRNCNDEAYNAEQDDTEVNSLIFHGKKNSNEEKSSMRIKGIPNPASNSKKVLHITVLAVTFSSFALLQRYSMWIAKDNFSVFTAVLLAELIKTIICLGVMFYVGKPIRNAIQNSKHMSIPAASYLIQNSLGYFIYKTGIEANIIQMLMQIKILTTALLSMLFLKKRPTKGQWRALLILFLAECIIIDSSRESACEDTNMTTNTTTNMTEDGTAKPTQLSYLFGIVATIFSCLTSAFAGVLMELYLKQKEPTEKHQFETHRETSHVMDLATKNLQLGIYSIGFSCISLVTLDFDRTFNKGIFYGLNLRTVALSCLLAFGGLYSALVIKELDVIWKSFASCLTVIIVAFVSAILFNTVITTAYMFGAPIVILSVWAYNEN